MVLVLKYSEINDIITYATGYSKHRVRTVMRECSLVYQESVLEGKDIDCGIFNIKHQLPGEVIYRNKVVDWDEMTRLVYNRMDLDLADVSIILSQYQNILQREVLKGQSVTLKGVGYLYPKDLEDGTRNIDFRIAPSLEKGKESEYVVIEEGVMKVRTIKGEDLRFSMGVNLFNE